MVSRLPCDVGLYVLVAIGAEKTLGFAGKCLVASRAVLFQLRMGG